MKEQFALCIPFDNNLKGRMGGNPPILIEELIPDNYRFYATITHPEKDNMMLSILIHEDFDTLLENNIYPLIEVKVKEHEYSEAGNNTDKRILSLGLSSISNYGNKQESEFLFIKVGGEPRLIQLKKYYYEELEKDNYSFFLQIEEEGYRDTLDIDYVFSYGALYLYKHNSTGEVIAGFWQYS
ncbi:hypothetical protein [Pedobacter caeni]|uniref:DUF1963 domain-containing protein n=1 Tax=Pedobacter caeni TaxID=288992 RepID=A0A1M5JRL8_9SPHI|nr:hypothetical protein [Pedobacter caeni]SHG43207.1 hypothetical protein SAMN04488522_105484 [Pedobacter caeni]